MAEENLDRAVAHVNLAQILGMRGKLEEGLAEAKAAAAAIARLLGERSERHGEALSLVASLLADLERHAEAAQQFARACDVIAFGLGEGTSRQAECWIGEIGALIGLRRFTDALALADRSLPILIKAYGDRHPQVATAYSQRGYLRWELGRPGGIADLEHALALFGEHQLDPGHRAGVQWALGRALWRTAPARARALVEEAVAQLRTANGTWAAARRDAESWLAAHPARR
jgi:hypothetical protein